MEAMASTYTTNKSIEQPASGDYVNTWATPVNADWEIIDTAFGGITTINVTGVTGPGVALSLSQYQPPNIEFTGTLSANLTYYVPSGVGGLWSVLNSTSGAFNLVFSCGDTGAFVTIAAGTRQFCLSTGSGMTLAQTPTNTLTSAAPSAQVGLSPVTGSTGHYMDAGSAPPINTGIAPTWTGIHTFSNTVDFTAGVGMTSGVTFNCAGTATFTGTTTISGVAAANYYHGTLGSAVITVSTSAPSGGANGDVWLQIA